MLAEISAGVGSLKAAFDIAKGLNAANSQVAINDVKIALQQHIIEGQNALAAAGAAEAAATQRIRELEQKLMEMENWEREAERYELKEFPTGAFAYVLKDSEAGSEPQHRICPRCYQDRHKAILQTTAKHRGGEKVECLRCKAELKLADFGPARIDYGQGRGWGA